MTGLDIFTFIVMAVLLAVVGVIVAVLGALPGRIARKCNHPQAEAINVCGWLGIVTLGVVWPVALVWAYTNPANTIRKDDVEAREKIAELSQRLSDLEERLRKPDTQQGDAG